MALDNFFYVFVDDVEEFALARAPRDPDLDKRVSAGAGRIFDWVPLQFTLEEGHIVTDYLANSFAFRLCSERLRDVIDGNKSHSDEVQWLPAIVRSLEGIDLPYWVLHFPTATDVINKLRTVMSGPVIVKAVLDSTLVEGHSVFSVRQDSVSLVVASAVRSAIETAGCSGIKFSKVPMA